MTDHVIPEVPGEAPTSVQPNDESNKKRKDVSPSGAQDANKKPKVQENRAIYVTNLPLDTNPYEIEQEFKKYGIIDQGADGRKRIKMYTDDNGDFNGEALIVYFKKESVDLAIEFMDDYWFRPEDQTKGKLSVKEADLSYKKNKDSDTIVSKLSRQDRKASERNRAELNRKLAEWSDNEEEVKETYAPKKNKWAKVVIIKHVFTLKEIEEDVAAIIDFKEEMREEAENFGTVTNVTLFDLEPDGVVTVRFREFDAAEKFCAKTDGRWYAQRVLKAVIADDKPKFKRSARGEEPDSEDEERLARVVDDSK